MDGLRGPEWITKEPRAHWLSTTGPQSEDGRLIKPTHWWACILWGPMGISWRHGGTRGENVMKQIHIPLTGLTRVWFQYYRCPHRKAVTACAPLSPAVECNFTDLTPQMSPPWPMVVGTMVAESAGAMCRAVKKERGKKKKRFPQAFCKQNKAHTRVWSLDMNPKTLRSELKIIVYKFLNISTESHVVCWKIYICADTEQVCNRYIATKFSWSYTHLNTLSTRISCIWEKKSYISSMTTVETCMLPLLYTQTQGN